MAMFNGGFPATYPQMYPQYQQPFQQVQNVQPLQTLQQSVAPQQPQNQSNIVWVEGEADARSFQLAPNTTMPLWDRNAQVIYYKSSDASGMPSLKILDYTIRDQNTGSNPLNGRNPVAVAEYVTKAEFDDLKAQFEKFSQNRQVKVKKEAVEGE